jgi:hypothetical protein
MSATATAAAPAVARIARRDGDDRRPGLARLTAVELRKMVDTRAGFWLQLAVAVLTVALVVVVCAVGHARDQTLREMLSLALQPASVLLPIVGILLVSSEWSQRTAPITFALVPGRSRVVAAKVLASVVLSLVVFVLCLAVAAIGTAVASPDVAHVWSLPGGLLLQDVLSPGDGDDRRRRLRRGAPVLGPGHRALVRAADRVVDRGRRGRAGRPRTLAGPRAHPRADDRARLRRHRVGARGDDARGLDGPAARHRPVAHRARRDPLSVSRGGIRSERA